MLSERVGTLGGLLLLEFGNSEVEGGDDVEEKDEKLDLGPVSLAECPESEEIVIHLERKPRPFHLSRLAFVLMEVLK